MIDWVLFNVRMRSSTIYKNYIKMRTWWNNLSNAFGCHWKHIDMWVGTKYLISCGSITLTICFRNRQKSFEWAGSVWSKIILSFSPSHHEGTPYPSKDTLSSSVCLKLHISMRLKIEPNSVRISFLELTNLISLTTGFELTPFIHCSTNHLALCPGPYATWPHPLYKNIASMVEVLYRMIIGLFQR